MYILTISNARGQFFRIFTGNDLSTDAIFLSEILFPPHQSTSTTVRYDLACVNSDHKTSSMETPCEPHFCVPWRTSAESTEVHQALSAHQKEVIDVIWIALSVPDVSIRL